MLLGLLVLMAAGTELLVRLGFHRLSRIQRTFVEECRAAIEQGHDRSSAVHVLIVGNSLLEAGLDYPRARKELAPKVGLRRIIVEDSAYNDWQYGLRRLLANGAHPQVLILCLSARQLTSPTVRGDYFAHYLMDSSDLIKVSSELHLHPTEASNYFFSNLSSFMGSRAEIRKWIISTAMPDFGVLAKSLARTNPPPLDPAFVENLSRQRLSHLANLCGQYGIRFELLLPPLLGSDDNSDAVRRAAAGTGVPVLVPIASGSLPRSDYSDGFHLNARGASVLTSHLLPMLGNLTTTDLGGSLHRPAE